MARWIASLPVLLGILLTPAPAWAECKLGKFAELPVTMVGRRPVVTVQINGRDARFLLDSGASTSLISAAAAREYGLRVVDLPNAELKGIGGAASVGEAVVSRLGLAGETLRDIHFLVGGSDTGFTGILGQNFLSIADVEYDLPHGVMRFTKSDGCKDVGLAYWAGTRPVAMVRIDAVGAGQWHTIGPVTVNGRRLKAIFDSGASGGTAMTLAAAKRLGVDPDGARTKPSGFASGIGQGRIRIWQVPFEKIDIGGEAIARPTLAIIDQALLGADMLIGIDFFLTHRIYVDNRNRRMFFTYEGGPLFGLNPQGAFDSSTGKAIDLTDGAGEPTDAAGYSRRGTLAVARKDFAGALFDFDKAVAMAPNEPQYLLQRAQARLSAGQGQFALADLDKAVELAPANADVRLQRAQLRNGRRDTAGALADLQAADKALAPTSDARLRLGQLSDAIGADALALSSFDQWIRSHAEDSDRPLALGGRCRARAALGRELDRAEDDCEAALRLRPNEPLLLESRALLRFRRGEYDKALADYTAIAALQPRNGWVLYARGLTQRRLGRTAQAEADRAAALAINPQQLSARAMRYGME